MLLNWKLLVGLLCAVCWAAGYAAGPGLKIRISSKGLNYANGVAENLLNAELRKVKIPDVHSGKNSARNMRLTVLRAPKFNYQVKPSGEIVWLTHSGQLQVRGDWRARKKILFVTLKPKGTFKATVTNVGVSISFKMDKTRVKDVKCKANIGHLSLKLKGGVLGWIINLFRKKIAKKIKPHLERGLCKEASKFINTDVNKKLSTFPTTKSIGKSFLVDYSMPYGPKVENGGLVSFHKGEIRRKDSNKPLGFNAPPMRSPSLNSKMLYVYLSDYILNSFLTRAYRKGKMAYTVMPRQFRTSCGDDNFCLGSIFPELSSQYPDATGSMRLQATSAPFGRIDHGKVTLSVRGKMTLSLHQQGKPSVKFLTCNLSFSLSVNPKFYTSSSKITTNIVGASIQIHQFSLSKPLQSMVGEDLSKEAAQFLADMATPTLINKANQAFSKGIEIPLTKGVQLRNVGIRLLNRMLEVSADVRYTG